MYCDCKNYITIIYILLIMLIYLLYYLFNIVINRYDNKLDNKISLNNENNKNNKNILCTDTEDIKKSFLCDATITTCIPNHININDTISTYPITKYTPDHININSKIPTYHITTCNTITNNISDDTNDIINNYEQLNDNKNILYDDFAPPTRYYEPKKLNKNIINIPTRGDKEDFQLFGILINNTDAFNLFGRKKFKNSDRYEYYIIGNVNNTQIKLPLDFDKEFSNNQDIVINQLNNKNFKVVLYEYNNFKYS